jgi:hypothetical protein
MLMDIGFAENVARIAEFGVGLMLVGLGLDVIRRAIRKRVHLHGHTHDEAGYHLHLHSHRGDGAHAHSAHAHRHPKGLPGRALVVGLMHGLAGSAALLVLAVTELGNVALGLAYVLLFGLGSMLGMAALSFTIALPLRASARYATWGFNGLNVAIGGGTAALGVFVVLETAPAVLALVA